MGKVEWFGIIVLVLAMLATVREVNMGKHADDGWGSYNRAGLSE